MNENVRVALSMDGSGARDDNKWKAQISAELSKPENAQLLAQLNADERARYL